MNYRLILVTFIFIFINNNANNKIIFLISPPRSMSVAFLRMMQSRGDFTILNEPSQYAFNLNFVHANIAKNWFKPNAPASFKDVKEKIFELSKKTNVFVKEISFAIKDFLLTSPELFLNPNMYFVFLIRNPHNSLISFYNKSPIIDENFSFLIGYKSCYEIFNEIKNKTKNKPSIILSEELSEYPEKIIKRFCEKVEIDFKPGALSWKDLGDDFEGDVEWKEIKPKEIAHHWHGDAIRSTEFQKIRNYLQDINTIIKKEHSEICNKADIENLQYYYLMLQNQNLILK